jgi:hypothetical protein
LREEGPGRRDSRESRRRLVRVTPACAAFPHAPQRHRAEARSIIARRTLLLLLSALVGAFVVSGCGGFETGETGTSVSSVSSGAFVTEARRLAPETGHFATCPDCHAYLDPPGAERPLLVETFGHEVHLQRGATCVDCHPTPVHAEEGTRKPGMAQCFTCHGQDSDAQASAECGLCHPPDMPLQPASHTEAFFAGGHAESVALSGTEECFVCHEGDEESFCTGCHGLAMPHPEGWIDPTGPGPGAHVPRAYDDAGVCVRCHGNTERPAPPGCYQGECHGG